MAMGDGKGKGLGIEDKTSNVLEVKNAIIWPLLEKWIQKMSQVQSWSVPSKRAFAGKGILTDRAYICISIY